MRNDAGESVYGIPQMPLDICVADSQGGIGYMIERILRNVLNKHGIKKNVISMITLVEINKDDPAFQEPNKRIGKVYNKEEAERLAKAHNWIFKPSSKNKNGYHNLAKLSSLAYTQGFYYVPRIDKNLISQYMLQKIFQTKYSGWITL